MNMKKILALVLALVMCLSLAACGGEEEAPEVTEAVEEESVAVEELEGADDPVSDESFTTLQECYALLVDLYNTFVETYTSDEVAASDTINELLPEAKALIEEIGEIDREGMTEGDALDLVNAMSDIVDALNALADEMAPAN